MSEVTSLSSGASGTNAPHWAAFYPELKGGEELAPLLECELERVRSTTQVQSLYRTNRVSRHWVNFELPWRTASVTIAANERLFMVDLWDRGVQMGSAQTPNLNGAVRVIHAFLADQLSTAELHERFPFLTIGDQAQVHELGVAAEVAWQWDNVKRHAAEFSPDLLPLLNTLVDRPPFNQLFPYMSLEALCFSRCTGCPYTGDCPVVVALGTDDYEVRDIRGKTFGRGDKNTALDLLITNTSPTFGPAVQGSAI